MVGDFGLFFGQLVGYLAAYSYFQSVVGVAGVFGAFALVRSLTRRTRQRGAGAQ